jgi:translation initiation factor 2B subunit (eIF-2B alpha/beta/delta family)
MSAIGNATAEVFLRVEKAVAEAEVPRAAAIAVVGSYLRQLDRAFAETVRQAAAVVPTEGMILTTSFSRTVIDALSAAGPEHVVVAEARPALEGRETARQLGEAGIEVTVVSDAAAPGIVREAALVLIGADAVLADGAVVNKMGSYPIALAAHAAKVEVYAACESLKISPLHTMPPEEHPGRELWKAPPRRVGVRNAYFELVASDLITGIVTEGGVLAPEEAARLAAVKRTALRAIGVN